MRRRPKLSDFKDALIKGLVAIESERETVKKEAENPMPKFPVEGNVPTGMRPFNPTELLISEMMCENTGAHIMDSGFYGRHWEKNRGVADPRLLEAIEVGDESISLRLWHYLTNHVEFDAQMDAEFLKYCEEEGHGTASMESFVADMDWHILWTENTYNLDTILDQDFYLVMFTKDGDEHPEKPYVLISTHNGADIRGGYSKPRAFKANDYDMFRIAMSEVQAHCWDCDEDFVTYDTGNLWELRESGKEIDVNKVWTKGEDGKPVHVGCEQPLSFHAILEW